MDTESELLTGGLMLLTVRDLWKSYPGQPPERAVLRGAALSLAAGETLALTGESGAGKSTLLHLIAALDGFDAGEIEAAGRRLSALDETGRAALRRGPVSIVFQQFNLVPSMTVAQNLSLHARLASRSDAAWAAELTARLGLEGLEQRYPEELSGGQQQRVAAGRALAVRPALLLADEPTGNLDETASEAVLALMLQLASETGTAVLLATHSAAIAARLGRRVHLSGGQLA